MKSSAIKFLVSLSLGLFSVLLNLNAQDNTSYVDPFIGTRSSDIKTVWGKYGGTYPGAVAPWGYVQLSPETSVSGERGYAYPDSEIHYFTCINHKSGYPEGSHGDVQVMFRPGTIEENIEMLSQTFKHANEQAEPGYYSVKFDNGSQVETTVVSHVGMFRYHSIETPFTVSIADAGAIEIIDNTTIYTSRYNGLFTFNLPWKKHKLENNTLILEFDALPKSGTLLVKSGFSLVDKEGSRNNLAKQCPDWNFDNLKDQCSRNWSKELSVAKIESGEEADLTKFYTALYHSFLIPYVISDADGRYRGADGQIHTKKGIHEYGMFSTWDTFRSLHPLLCLFKPQRQLDMLNSMLNIYDQRGYLPHTPMTGYHSIPIFADSYVKGITDFDTDKAYAAMSKFLIGKNSPRDNTYKYIANGYLNDSIEESVSVTLDYAYNDWALAVFAEATGHADDAKMLYDRSFNYRNLFDIESGFILPRNKDGFVKNPGGMGYKEANKWTAWFVPHNVRDLINLSGGDQIFAERIDNAIKTGHVIHDNETVLHYPYFFSYAGRPDLTNYWVDRIRETCYTSTPGGIPGNDDLGSMSSWYVFSALGFYPTCPGSTEYVLTTPLFTSTSINLENGNTIQIATDQNIIHQSFASIELNGNSFNQSYINHKQLIGGAKLHFKSGEQTDLAHLIRPSSHTTASPDFQFSSVSLSSKEVVANQEAYVCFTVDNRGATGVYSGILKDNEQIIGQKNVYVGQGETVSDSIPFQLYHRGDHLLSLSTKSLLLYVKQSEQNKPLVCTSLVASSLNKRGEVFDVSIELQNISDRLITGQIPLLVDNIVIAQLTYRLEPGDRSMIKEKIVLDKSGFYNISVLDKEHKVKIYSSALESCVLDVDFERNRLALLKDKSGFDNHALIDGNELWIDGQEKEVLKIGPDSYISFPDSESLNITGETITMAAWICPMNESEGYIDFFTKGDYNVLQTTGDKLSFFAGGWGRGECFTALPTNWLNNWHYVVGVCDGKELKLYVNGELKQSEAIEGEIEETEVQWNLGRNAEMPYSRRFEGLFGNVQIYKEALSAKEIEYLFQNYK